MLVTFVIVDGNPVLRITHNGESCDYYLREGQVKMLLRQMMEWLTR